MKTKYKYLMLTFMTILFFNGCKNDFLELTPQAAIVYDNYFKTKQDAVSFINSIYEVLGWDNVHGIADWAYGDVVSDDSEKGGENGADRGTDMGQMEIFATNAGNPMLAETWKELYVGIFRANVALLKIPEISDSTFKTPVKNRLIAEAKFLRAYYYFRLNIIFHGVPLVTKPLSPNDYKQPRNSAEDIWNQIESDLKQAIPDLPLKNEVDEDKDYDPAKDMGRATSGAAKALLVKTYIFQKKWDEAKTLALEIINTKHGGLSTEYDLETSYPLNFKLENKNGIESFFEVQQGVGFPKDYDYGWGNGDLGTLINIYQLSRNNGGFGFNVPTVSLWNEFEASDPRRGYTIAKSGERDDFKYGLRFDCRQSNTKMVPKKYCVPREKIGVELSEGPSNIKIIRYSDLLLWYAEASAMTGDDATAKTFLKYVRNRVGLSDYPSDAKYSITIDAIYHERRVELALEGHRFFDLVRTSRAYDAIKAEADSRGATTNFQAGKHEYFPIPAIEIQLSGGKMIQNNNY